MRRDISLCRFVPGTEPHHTCESCVNSPANNEIFDNQCYTSPRCRWVAGEFVDQDYQPISEASQ